MSPGPQFTITHFYRTEAYVEQIRLGMQRLNKLLEESGDALAILEELQNIRATIQEAERHLQQRKGLLSEISGQMMGLKKEIIGMILKAE